MEYDIIQVEDTKLIRGLIEGVAQRQNITYCGVPTLQDLESLLNESSAKVYIVDGEFPSTKGGCIDKNAPKAIALIRNKDSDARIILYSGTMNAEDIARENNVTFMDKGGEYADFNRLVSRIKERYLNPTQI